MWGLIPPMPKTVSSWFCIPVDAGDGRPERISRRFYQSDEFLTLGDCPKST